VLPELGEWAAQPRQETDCSEQTSVKVPCDYFTGTVKHSVRSTIDESSDDTSKRTASTVPSTSCDTRT